MHVSVAEASSRAITRQSAHPWRPDNPGLHTQSITFERFRSHGLSRTIREGSRERFVTPERLLQILRGTRLEGDITDSAVSPTSKQDDMCKGNLAAVGMTEYIDVSPVMSGLEAN